MLAGPSTHFFTLALARAWAAMRCEDHASAVAVYGYRSVAWLAALQGEVAV